MTLSLAWVQSPGSIGVSAVRAQPIARGLYIAPLLVTCVVPLLQALIVSLFGDFFPLVQTLVVTYRNPFRSSYTLQ